MNYSAGYTLLLGVALLLFVWAVVPTYHKVNALESQVAAIKAQLNATQTEIQDLQDQFQKLVWISQDIDRRLIERGQ
jgi:cell division protein FtsB